MWPFKKKLSREDIIGRLSPPEEKHEPSAAAQLLETERQNAIKALQEEYEKEYAAWIADCKNQAKENFLKMSPQAREHYMIHREMEGQQTVFYADVRLNYLAYSRSQAFWDNSHYGNSFSHHSNGPNITVTAKDLLKVEDLRQIHLDGLAEEMLKGDTKG